MTRLNITQAVSAQAKAEEYSAEAVKCGGTLKIHIKVDTGMSVLDFCVMVRILKAVLRGLQSHAVCGTLCRGNFYPFCRFR